MSRTTLTLAVAVALSSLPALAAPANGACAAMHTSYLDSLLNPVKGSDEKFFSTGGGPPSIVFLMGNNDTMQDYPTTPLPTLSVNGCGPTGVVAPYTAITGFNLLTDGATPYDADSNFPGSTPSFFDPTKIYRSNKNHLASSAISSDFRSTNATDCSSSGNALGCAACLAAVGYYRNGSDDYFVSGKVLNVFPPKFVIARKVLKDVVGSLNNVRMGIATFGPNAGMYDPPVMLHPVKPNCDQSVPFVEGTLRPDVRSQINAVQFDNNERSIGEALFGIGAYFSSQKVNDQWGTWFRGTNIGTIVSGYPGDPTGWGSSPHYDGADMWIKSSGSYQMPQEAGGQQKSMCWPCQQSAVIVLTDGQPEADNSVPVTRMLRLLIAQNAKHPDGTPVTFNPGTSGACNGTGPSPGGINYCNLFGVDKCACDYNGSPSGPDQTNKNYMDDVAFFLSHMDLRTEPGMEGTQSVRTYTIGFGDNSPMLQSIAMAGDGLFYRADNANQLKAAILSAIEDIKSRSNAFAGSAVAAVQAAGGGSSTSSAILPRMLPRSGRVWEGSLYRFEQFNEFVQDTNYNPLPADGGDNDKNDVFLVDSAGSIVVEDPTLGFVKAGTTTPAAKYWEAGERLRALGHGGRTVVTVLANNAGTFVPGSATTAFTTANVNALIDYLGVAGTNYCPSTSGSLGTIFTKLGLTTSSASTLFSGAPTGNQADLNKLCAMVLIDWVRGRDLGAETSANRSGTRHSILGDIFHSTPAVVEPPADTFLCDLGIVNQCARTIYASSDVAQLAAATTYEGYVTSNNTREKLVVVGSNGGMLHAFRNGTGTVADGGVVNYSQGNGDEVWAFIPPDILPRLKDMVTDHVYAVDGDIMVRDIWRDDNNDKLRQATEFHTMVIASEGRGGTHYFAVEPTWNGSGIATSAVKFRWMYPEPSSQEAAVFGKTFFALAPKPPPIGPIRVKISGNIVEKWVVALSGGWSPGRERGRGVYFVDAYDGTLYRKFEFDDDANSDDDKPRRYLTQSVTAPVAMIDYGTDTAPAQDGYFDTALFADLSGQIWLLRMNDPDPTTWTGGRALEMDRDGLAPTLGDLTDPSPDNPKSVLARNPFYFLPSTVIEPGTNRLIAYIGSGNRYALLEPGPGTCRYDNPLACAKLGATETKIAYKVDGPKWKVDKAETHWKAYGFEHGKLDGYNTNTQGMCTGLTAEYSDFKVGACAPASATAVTPGDVNKVKVQCSGDPYVCAVTSSTNNYDDLVSSAATSPMTVAGNRFLSVWVYGGSKDDGGVRRIDGTHSAKDFDDGRLSDSELYNVSKVSCTVTGCDGGAPAGGPGWYLEYPENGAKTATGSSVLASCVLWSTMEPPTTSSSGSDPCASLITPTSRIFQADALTGQPNCATSFLADGGYVRSIARGVLAPPPEPATTIQISKTGQIKYSAMIMEPGQSQATTLDVTGGQDPLQLIYQLPISRSLHNCRHAGDGGTANCSVMP